MFSRLTIFGMQSLPPHRMPSGGDFQGKVMEILERDSLLNQDAKHMKG